MWQDFVLMVPHRRWLTLRASRENKEVKWGGGVVRWRPSSAPGPCCHCAAEVLCLSTHVSLCFPTGVKRGHCTSEMSCQRSPHVSPHISLKQDSLCPLPPPLLSFFIISHYLSAGGWPRACVVSVCRPADLQANRCWRVQCTSHWCYYCFN